MFYSTEFLPGICPPLMRCLRLALAMLFLYLFILLMKVLGVVSYSHMLMKAQTEGQISGACLIKRGPIITHNGSFDPRHVTSYFAMLSIQGSN
jgi:hypothetical protein